MSSKPDNAPCQHLAIMPMEGRENLEQQSKLALFRETKILVVEDEYFFADETKRKLEKLGAVVIGPTGSVQDALVLLDNNQVDGAILDIHLGDEQVFPVADELDSRDIPFVFATGYNPAVIPAKYTGFALCEKPMELGRIGDALFGAAGLRALNLGSSLSKTVVRCRRARFTRLFIVPNAQSQRFAASS